MQKKFSRIFAVEKEEGMQQLLKGEVKSKKIFKKDVSNKSMFVG